MTKDKVEHEMYFVNGILPNLVKGAEHIPPPAFSRRYEIYFQKQPPAFPTCAVLPSPEARFEPQPAAVAQCLKSCGTKRLDDRSNITDVSRR
jgi:hypothetical protein